MLKTINICFAAIILCCHAGYAAGTNDRRLEAISALQLQKAITQTATDSPLQQEILSRARHSHLMDLAYIHYTALWQREPNSAYANLLRGVAAEYLGSDSMKPELAKRYKQFSQEKLFPVALACLEKSARLAPNSSVVNMEAGFFLWQFGGKLSEGLTLLKKAVRLAPDDPRIRATWGLVYANPEGEAYNLQRAIQQLNIAAALDSTYAFPHDLLANIYTRLHQTSRAQQEQELYQSLIP